MAPIILTISDWLKELLHSSKQGSTMAEGIALRNALQCIGFLDEALTDIVDEQGFNSVNDFALLMDDKATNICKITHHPGGAQVNGNPNPGLSVSLKAKNYLKMMCYLFRYDQHTSHEGDGWTPWPT